MTSATQETGRVQTFDHTGFVVEDIGRAHDFYGSIFGARPLRTVNLKTRTYAGWPIISFVQMGLHRFELCLAQHPLPDPAGRVPLPRIGFAILPALADSMAERITDLGVAVEAAPPLPDEVGLHRVLRLTDPDHNIVELAVWDGQDPSKVDTASQAPVFITDISHLALEVTDLGVAEEFYTEALGLRVAHRDDGEVGSGRIVLKNATGQVLVLEQVDVLSPRSRFCGPDVNTAPKLGGPKPYAGAHLAFTARDLDDYAVIESRLREFDVVTEQDIRKDERPVDERSEYFYDPSGNRLQIITQGSSSASS